MTNPYAPPQAAVQDISDPQVQAVPADRGTRLGAAILDNIIFVAIVYVPFLLFAVIGAGTATGNANVAAGIVLALVGFAVWCWFTITYMSRNGQSIAKKLLGIKVVRSDSTPASLGRLIWLRNVVNGVLSMVPLYAFVDLLFIFGESQQCLHDKIADTIVVKA